MSIDIKNLSSPPFAPLSTTRSNLVETNLGIRQGKLRSHMHKHTILASEPTLDGISSSVSGTGRRDEEIQKLALTPNTAAYQ